MSTRTVEVKTSTQNREKLLKAATSGGNMDQVLHNVKEMDNTCSFAKCKTSIANFAITCQFCNGRFCTSHNLPEIHGCGEAVRRDEKRKYLHPHQKLSEEKHSQAQTKLNMRMKQLQQERKSKQGFSNKGKK